MPFANNGDVRLNYEAVGGGPDIVLIHANPFDRRLWRFQVEDFPTGTAWLQWICGATARRTSLRSFHIR